MVVGFILNGAEDGSKGYFHASIPSLFSYVNATHYLFFQRILPCFFLRNRYHFAVHF